MKKFPKVVVNRRHYFLKYDKNIKVNIKKKKIIKKRQKNKKKVQKLTNCQQKLVEKLEMLS